VIVSSGWDKLVKVRIFCPFHSIFHPTIHTNYDVLQLLQVFATSEPEMAMRQTLTLCPEFGSLFFLILYTPFIFSTTCLILFFDKVIGLGAVYLQAAD
jgi:hypothetical protein